MKNKTCKHLESIIQDTLEKIKADWNVNVYKQDKNYYAELEFNSHAGEDFVFDIWFDGTVEDFADNLWEYSQGFDPDEHAEMWVPSRGKNGVPSSIRALIRDAEDIQEELETVAEKFRKEVANHDEII